MQNTTKRLTFPEAIRRYYERELSLRDVCLTAEKSFDMTASHRAAAFRGLDFEDCRSMAKIATLELLRDKHWDSADDLRRAVARSITSQIREEGWWRHTDVEDFVEPEVTFENDFFKEALSEIVTFLLGEGGRTAEDVEAFLSRVNDPEMIQNCSMTRRVRRQVQSKFKGVRECLSKATKLRRR